jgi:hypothetical protein
MAKTLVWNQGNQGSIPFTKIYYVEYVYSYTYFVYVCKCIVPRWVVDRWIGREVLTFIYYLHFYFYNLSFF